MEFYRKIYKLNITLASPLSIGSGANANTDKDVIVDRCGLPFIPASSLAGVLRSYISANRGRALENALFGYTADSKEAKRKIDAKDPDYIERRSLVRVYDGLCKSYDPDHYFITTRDMVALKNRIGIDGAKFDMEAVETGAEFVAYIELLKPAVSYLTCSGEKAADIPAEIDAALSAMNAGKLRLGTKTTRGYGAVRLQVQEIIIVNVNDWLEFDMTDPAAWQNAVSFSPEEDSALKLALGLRLRGGISIREYTTAPGAENETMPDYMQLSLHTVSSDGEVAPVIPGTSWAGAIRARFTELARDGGGSADTLFGFVRQRKIGIGEHARKSTILFSESRLSGGVWKQTTRNAIDRFTAGTKAKALYTEKTYFGGETELEISFTKEPSKEQKLLLCACLADLHNGFLSVGGLAAVGRGLFTIESVNGSALSEEEKKPEAIFEKLKKEAGLV